jgi:hypothetical protein
VIGYQLADPAYALYAGLGAETPKPSDSSLFIAANGLR